ncbi:MAG: FtsX-like permease family protein [Deltaproteobacteria bacterium]|nr:FtsX-like permease family protein [Deltaproteobacteria bacterium]
MGNWIERQRSIIDFTLSLLWRRKGKNLALLLVYTAVVFLLASVFLLTDSLKKEASILLGDSPEMIVQRMPGERRDLIPTRYAEKIRQIGSVAAVRTRLWGYYYDPVAGANYTLMVPENSAPGPSKIIIGEGVSRVRLAYAGDTLEFRTSDGNILELDVEGTLSRESALISSDLVLLSESDFRRITGIPAGYATDIAVRLKEPGDRSSAAMEAAALLPDTRQILREDILRTYAALFGWRDGIMGVVLLSSLIALAILAWDKASGLSSDERKEIGILKAVGWQTSGVLLLKFWEGITLSLTAFFVGILLAYSHVYFASSFIFQPVLKGWAVLYPHFGTTPFISPLELAIPFLLTVVPFTAATMLPAWRTASVDPDSAMR